MADHVKTIERALAAWSNHDLDTYMKLYRPDATIHGLGPEPLNVAQTRVFYDGVHGGFPDMKLEWLDRVSEGDKVTVRFRAHGTHQGPFMGVPASGRKVSVEGITILRFQGVKSPSGTTPST